ncbi:hypothetical protein MVEN_00183100 [Mycena venus]|uniref:Concanavalin A-like lectin/glucanase n=1 Tax=Mycena venus TaxID=2733690 RepID=A0A8H7DDX5_9AGAR|nr:hypothetical protein MVEN_00183100 [Mycena venus]
MRASISTTRLLALFAHLTFTALAIEKGLVPGGYRAKTNIHTIPAGGSLAHVGKGIHILDASGTVVHVATRTPNSNSVSAIDSSPPHTRSLLSSGWISYVGWLNPAPPHISSFTTTWTVPPVPKTDRGQTVFLFNSLLPSASSSINNRCCRWYGPSDAGGGSFWSVATWYIDNDDNAFFTPPIPTTPGETLDGIITLTSTNGSSLNYNSQFTNIPGTSLKVTSVPKPFSFATEMLEAYNIVDITDYPAGATVFTDINVDLVGGGDAEPKVGAGG